MFYSTNSIPAGASGELLFEHPVGFFIDYPRMRLQSLQIWATSQYSCFQNYLSAPSSPDKQLKVIFVVTLLQKSKSNAGNRPRTQDSMS